MNILTDQSYYTYYPSPIGILKIEFNNQALLSVEFDDHLREVKNNCQQNFYEDPKLLNIYNLIFDQLNQYFMGERSDFEIPLNLDGNSFELKVWRELKKIPYAEVYSYKEIAGKISKSSSIAKVVEASFHNPISIIIPSHRLVSSEGNLKSYSGGIWRKKWLLNHENNKSKNIERKISFV